MINSLELVEAGEVNADIVYPHIADASNYEFLEERAPTREEHRRRYAFAASRRSPDNPEMIWLYWLAKSGDDYVGAVEIAVFPGENTAEMGFVTFSPFRGKGLATAFCRMAIAGFRLLFPEMPLQASVNELNDASMKVLWKLGFELIRKNPEAELINGVQMDELVYELPVSVP